MKPTLPLAVIGLPPMWFPTVLRDLVTDSAQGEWTEGGTACVLEDDAVAGFCLMVRDRNMLHESSGARKAVVPGALLSVMLPALVPHLFDACAEVGALIDAGGQRLPVAMLRVGTAFQARIRLVSTKVKGGIVSLDVLAEIYSPKTRESRERVRARVTQSLIIKRKTA